MLGGLQQRPMSCYGHARAPASCHRMAAARTVVSTRRRNSHSTGSMAPLHSARAPAAAAAAASASTSSCNSTRTSQQKTAPLAGATALVSAAACAATAVAAVSAAAAFMASSDRGSSCVTTAGTSPGRLRTVAGAAAAASAGGIMSDEQFVRPQQHRACNSRRSAAAADRAAPRSASTTSANFLQQQQQQQQQQQPPMKMVLCVNQELKMGKGKIGAQCAHAAVGLVVELLQEPQNQELYQAWRDYSGQAKIVVRVQDSQQLNSLADAAAIAGQPTYIMQDAGRTQVAPGSQTVLAIGPGSSEDIQRLTGHLQLL